MALEAVMDEPQEAPEAEETQEETQEEPNETIETLATEMGWRPKEEFKGDEETYVDAATYIRKGEDIKESMRQHLKDNRRKMTDMERGIEDLKQHNERVFKTQLEKQRKEIEELRNRKREAIEEGDADRVDEIEGEMLEKYNSMEEPTPRPRVDPEDESAFARWRGNNPWYSVRGEGGDGEMTEYADRLADMPEYAALPYARKLERVTERVKKEYPDKFRPQPSANAVEAPQGSPGKRQYTARDLSSDQRAIMKNFVNRGIMTEKQYIKDLADIGEIG